MGAYICAFSQMYMCIIRMCELEMCFLHIPLPLERPSESGVTARDQALLMATQEQLRLSAMFKDTSTDLATL